MANKVQKTSGGMKDVLRFVILGGLFIIPFLTLYVANTSFFPYITGKNFAFRIIVEVVLALWVVLACYDAQYRPRFSWILAAFSTLIVVMFAANLHAVNTTTAFWSNFERMDGYVTLVHVFLYFIMLGTMLRTQKMWSFYLHTSLVAAGIVAIMGLSQLSAASVRVDSTLGNAAYMAVYMLFHIFFVVYLFARTKVLPYRIMYVLLAILFLYVLLQTGTRGTVIGLTVGAVTTVAYLALFATKAKEVRKYAFGSFVFVVLCVGAFIAARDTSYIQSKPSLARIANIDLRADLGTRSMIWGMAVEGVKERPVLGWGQGNFNYVFNQNYDPRLFSQEQWFDRTHNIFFDWLIAGGILGFISYFSIFAAILYYLVITPLRRADTSFTLIERGILLGLVAGYLTHNLVVFDNIVSYMFFAAILGLIHSRVSTEIPALMKIRIPDSITTQVVVPVALIVMMVGVYVVNVPGIKAAGDIITAFQAPDASGKLAGFEKALQNNSFAQQEIVEQLAQQAMGVVTATDQAVPPAIKEQFRTRSESELLKMVAEKPGDARLHVFLASYYRAVGELAKAETEMNTARTLSPKKQAIILQQGAIQLSLGKNEAARDFFKEAYELDTRNDEAKEYYVASLFYVKDAAAAKALVDASSEEFKKRLAASDFAMAAVNSAGEYAFLAELYEFRVVTNPSDPQNWASLAFLYHQIGQKNKAIDALNRAATAAPTFATMAKCIQANMVADREPQLGCQPEQKKS